LEAGGNSTFPVNGSIFSVDSSGLGYLQDLMATSILGACYLTLTTLPLEGNITETVIECPTEIGAAFNAVLENTTNPVASANTIVENLAIAMTNK